jgi:hypothetical protein
LAVLLKKRLINPGTRKMTARQKLFFGTKRQRAAVSRRLTNKGKKRTKNHGKRVRNVGEIITLGLPRKKAIEVIKNPMPVKRRTRNAKRRRNAPNTWSSLYQNYYNPAGSSRIATRRRSRSAAYKGRRGNSSKTKLANPRRRRRSVRVITKYRYRNPARLANSRRRYHRRTVRRYRNPGFLSSDIAKVAGILGGATVTNLVAKQIPSKYTTGTLGYATLTAVAFGQGYVVKKFLRNNALGDDMMIGGLVLVAMKLMSDLFPSVSLPFSLTGGGMGLIGNSSFTNPQVPVPGSMGRFQIAPNYQQAINAAIPATRTLAGINQSVTMGGRTGSRRVGRIN